MRIIRQKKENEEKERKMQERREDDVLEIDLLELFGLLLHKLWLLALCTVLAGALGYVLSAFAVTPQYESTTGVYILSSSADNSTLSYSDTQLATQLTKDYEELITCRSVLEAVIEECGLEDSYGQLLERVSVENAADTRIVYITVKDPNPARAQEIADSIREIASDHIKEVTDVEAVNVVDTANLPSGPSEPSILKWTAIGAALGLVLCAAVVVIRYLLDDTIKSSEDVENYLGLSTLALIPMLQGESSTKKKKRKAGQDEPAPVIRHAKIKSVKEPEKEIKTVNVGEK